MLENHRVALLNVETQSVVSTVMAELGYENQKLAEGKSLLALARQAYDLAKKEGDETSEAYLKFTALRDQLDASYAMHRKKAKVVFRNDSLSLQKLGVLGAVPRTYIKWLDTLKTFYATATTDQSIATQLERLKIAPSDLKAAVDAIAALETERANFIREKGESQEATQLKMGAFDKMNDWMSEFYAVARIALDDSPQLLEVLAKTVRAN